MTSPDNFQLCREADAFVFDIDGTLLNTRDLVHYNALNSAMREVYGADTTIDGVPYHGMTDLSILRASLARAGVSDTQFEIKLAEALAVVRREVERNAAKLDPKICPGVRETLGKLQQERKLLGVASGNLETVGWRKIEAAGLRRFFSFGCFSDQNERRAAIFRNAVEAVSHECRAAQVCFVGDTPADIEAARETGAKVISVCTGNYGRSQLSLLSPDLCLDSCAELFSRL
jgi:phosphoglycolate phosphatase